MPPLRTEKNPRYTPPWPFSPRPVRTRSLATARREDKASSINDMVSTVNVLGGEHSPAMDGGRPTTSRFQDRVIAPTQRVDTENSASWIAEAKLQRQNERIEQNERVFQNTGVRKELQAPAQQQHPKDNKLAQASTGLLNTADKTQSMYRQFPIPAYTGMLPADMTRQDSGPSENAGYQVYTGRKARRAANEHNVGDKIISARQDKLPLNSNQRDMLQVFGTELPGPDFLQQSAGEKDGEVRFVQHPNGDVSAHQWSASFFQWVNIGQFSNTRKKTEGGLASDRLRGETTQQTLQQNTLAYFRAIAKQREALAMGLPFGPKEVQDTLPAPMPARSFEATTSARPPVQAPMPPPIYVDQVVSNTTNVDSKSMNTAKADAPSTSASLPASTASSGLPLGRFSFARRALPMQTDDPFVSSSSTPSVHANHSRWIPPLPLIGGHTSQRAVRDAHFAPGHAASVNMAMPAPGHASDKPDLATLFRNRANLAGQRSTNPTSEAISTNTQRFPLRNNAQSLHASLVPSVAAAENAAPDRHRTNTQVDRNALRRHLFNLSEVAKQRSISQNHARALRASMGRLGLGDDDMHADTSTPMDMRRRQSQTERAATEAALLNPHHLDFPLETTSDVRSLLANSSPDGSNTGMFGHGSAYASDRQLVADATALRQAMIANRDPMPPKSRDEELYDWWMSGQKFARQEELFQSIMAHSTQQPQLRVTGMPNRAPPYNPYTTRVMLGVQENLASYLEGPPEQRRDYWCQWTTPQEWCIDRSPRGNDSYYDSEWGQPPARVGRDARYRPLPVEMRFSGYSPAGSLSSAQLAIGSPPQTDAGVMDTRGGHRAVGSFHGGWR